MYLASYQPVKYVNEPVSYPYIKIPNPIINILSLTRINDTITAITTIKHGYSNSNIVIITGAIQSEYNGTYSIAIIDDYTFTYTITGTPTTPATGTIFVTLAPQYPITLQQLYDQVRIDAAPEQLSYLNLILGAVTLAAESYMNINIIYQAWRTFRCDFGSNVIQLRKSPFFSLQSFQILSGGVFIDVDPNIYYISKQPYYDQIALKKTNSSSTWPYQLLDPIDNSIKIEFTAGLAADSTTVPNDLQSALLNHATFLYENRGNNDIVGIEGQEGLAAIPNLTKLIYDNYRVPDILGGSIYNEY